MDVIEYLKTEKRICGFYTQNDRRWCHECPLGLDNNGMGVKCSVFVMQEPEKCMEVMKKWEEEHPRKTIVQELLEKYPDVRINNRGIPPELCPSDLGYSEAEKCGTGNNICVKCWNRSPEEAKE